MKSLRFLMGALIFGPLVMAAPAQTANDVSENLLLRDVKRLGADLVAAINQADVPAALKRFHTNCIVTWCNAEISRGPEGVRAFRERLLGGTDRRVESFNCEILVDDFPFLTADGATAICSGGFNERFKIPGGRVTDLQGRWSATLTKREGDWLIANLQLSTNPFDNSLLRLAKQAGWVVGVVSLFIGSAVGWFLGRRRKPAA